MTLHEFLTTADLEHSLLVGYYGGGNFGDELLLEVLSTRLHQSDVKDVTIAYQDPPNFDIHHHDYGYHRITMGNKRELLSAIRHNRTIVIGGGGLWGLDVNANIFLLSLLLFVSRWLLGKRVYLLGVGYYGSTSRLGHLSAWLAGKAATHIIARDAETAANFKRLSHHVSDDTDIAWELPHLSLDDYRAESVELERSLPINNKTLFIAIRRFKPHQRNNFNELVGGLLKNNQHRPTIVSLMEPRDVDPEGYAQLQRWQELYPRITIADFNYNPLALYIWFTNHAHRLLLIAPQFHLLALALLTDTKFLPIVYDNKVRELLVQAGHASIDIDQLDGTTIQNLIDVFYKARR